MRWLAAALIMLFSLMCADNLTQRLAQRRQLLESLYGFVQRMSAQIIYALVPPERIIRDCDDGEQGFFSFCSDGLDRGMSVEQAWESAVGHCAAVHTLKSDERRLLCELGSRLGVYDAQLQLSVLEDYSMRLEELRRAAVSEHKEKARLNAVCSLLGGLLVSILIIK